MEYQVTLFNGHCIIGVVIGFHGVKYRELKMVGYKICILVETKRFSVKDKGKKSRSVSLTLSQTSPGFYVSAIQVF